MSPATIELESGGVLQLKEGQQISFESSNPAFDEETIAGAFSWPIQLPATGSNKAALGWAHLPESMQATSQQKAILRISGLELPCMVNLSKASRDYYEVQIMAGSSIVAPSLGKELSALSIMGEHHFFGSGLPWPRDFASSGNYTSYMTGVKAYIDNVYNTPTYADPAGLRFAIIRNHQYPNQINYLGTGLDNNNKRLAPQFSVLYLLKTIFAESGISLSGSVFGQAFFRNLLTLGPGVWPSFTSAYGVCPDNLIALSRFVPSISQGEFVKTFCKYFFQACFFDVFSGKARIVPLKAMLASTDTLDLSDRVVTPYAVEYSQKGEYTLAYGEAGDDESFSSSYFKPSLEGETLGTPVADTATFIAAAGPEEELRLVVNKDLIYKRKVDSSGIATAEQFATPIQNFNPAQPKTWNLKGLPVWSNYRVGFTLEPNVDFAPGSKLTAVRFLQWLGVEGGYPIASHLDTNMGAEVKSSGTLLMEGAKGVYELHGKEWIKMMEENCQKVVAKLRLTDHEAISFDFSRKVRIGNAVGFVTALKFSLPVRGFCEAEILIV